jgi:nitrogenase molybdenum-iron protein alpha chain
MSYVKGREAPKREDRLNSGIAYGGTLSDFRCRLGCDGEGSGCAFRDGSRTFSQGSLCLLLPALAIINSFGDNVTLMHAAVGCGSCLHSQNAGARSGNLQRNGIIKDSIWVSTALNEFDIINGGEEKLKSAIIEVDKTYYPKTITVVAGCVPGVNGDDIDGVIDLVKDQVAAKLIAVHCEGFKTRMWATAYDQIYHGLARTLFEDPLLFNPKRIIEDEAERFQFEKLKKDTVNLFNLSSIGKIDEDEMVRLLNSIGLNVNIFPVFQNPDKVYRLKYAAFSISACPTHDDYCLKFFKEAFGIPYSLAHMPIGIKSTGDWIRDAARLAGREDAAERFIKNEEGRLLESISKYREFFGGKRVFVSAGEFRALATARLLHELGFEIAAVRPYHHDELALAEYEELEKIAPDIPFNIANVQPYEEANLLKKLNPDLFLGHSHSNFTSVKLGIPTSPVFNSGYAFIGYRGVFELARRLYKQLSNTALSDNISKNIRLPYREEWYSKNPFAYIKNAGGDIRR